MRRVSITVACGVVRPQGDGSGESFGRNAGLHAPPYIAGASQKAKTREAGGYAGFVLLFVVGAKGFEPSTL